ncbi:MAG: lysine decarboxylase, partial [Sphingomonadales bacterium]|nr:lysine decarboxylase [Sphingomonadales bacterium]
MTEDEKHRELTLRNFYNEEQDASFAEGPPLSTPQTRDPAYRHA